MLVLPMPSLVDVMVIQSFVLLTTHGQVGPVVSSTAPVFAPGPRRVPLGDNE
jgi:hypothetical protein